MTVEGVPVMYFTKVFVGKRIAELVVYSMDFSLRKEKQPARYMVKDITDAEIDYVYDGESIKDAEKHILDITGIEAKLEEVLNVTNYKTSG